VNIKKKKKKPKRKRDLHVAPSQFSHSVGIMNQEAEEGKETQIQACMTELWKTKRVSSGEAHTT
jgi:hypothetical protein